MSVMSLLTGLVARNRNGYEEAVPKCIRLLTKVCVCVRERERETNREIVCLCVRERETETVYACMCYVCVQHNTNEVV